MEKLALFGGTPVRTTPFTPWPQFDDRERKYLNEALESRNWGGYPYPSPLAAAFGQRFADFHGARYGFPCANGSVTLEVALQACGIEAGDEVIVPCYTFMASASCVVRLNGVPVFVDVEDRNWCLDPAAFEAAITPRTRFVIPVHLGHQTADMDRILEIANRHGITVIEDCAHAHGGQWRGQGLGSMGAFGSFSFQSSKLMTSGEGGALICSDDTLRQKAMSVVNCGRHEPGYDSFGPGYLFGGNYRLSELQVAVLTGQMDRLEELTRKRAAMFDYFRKTLHENVQGVRVLDPDPRVTRQHAYQTLMRYDSNAFQGIHRNRFIEALLAEGVEFEGDFYIPLYQIPIFNAKSAQWPMLRERYGEGILEGGANIQCPVAEKAAYDESLWMHYPVLSGTTKDCDDVIEAIRKVQRHASDLA